MPRGIDPGFGYNPGAVQGRSGSATTNGRLAAVTPRELPPGALSLGAIGMPATWRLPPPRPVPAGALMAPGLKPQQYVDAFLAEFGGKPEFTDVAGEKLVITDDLFRNIRGDLKILKRGRERFIQLLAQTIKDPDEIWMARETHYARSADVIRRRYVARWRIEGEAKPVLGVFELGKDGWRGVTGFQAESSKEVTDMLADARRGELVYRRK